MKYMLTFPDGTQIGGFSWCAIGAYVKFFPNSGIHSAQANSLTFTARALEDANITISCDETPIVQKGPDDAR